MGETIVETMNREFKEETGTALTFTEERHCFSFVEYRGTNIILTSMFCLMTSDLALFSGTLCNFPSGTTHQRGTPMKYLTEALAAAAAV